MTRFKPNQSVSSITEGRKLSISHPALHQTSGQVPHPADMAATDVLVTPTNDRKTSWKRYANDVIALSVVFFLQSSISAGKTIENSPL